MSARSNLQVQEYCEKSAAAAATTHDSQTTSESRQFLKDLGLPSVHPFCDEHGPTTITSFEELVPDAVPEGGMPLLSLIRELHFTNLETDGGGGGRGRRAPPVVAAASSLLEAATTLAYAKVPPFLAFASLWARLLSGVVAPVGVSTLLLFVLLFNNKKKQRRRRRQRQHRHREDRLTELPPCVTMASSTAVVPTDNCSNNKNFNNSNDDGSECCNGCCSVATSTSTTASSSDCAVNHRMMMSTPSAVAAVGPAATIQETDCDDADDAGADDAGDDTYSDDETADPGLDGQGRGSPWAPPQHQLLQYLQVLSVVTVAASIVIMTDSMYVYELGGPLPGIALFSTALVLSIFCNSCRGGTRTTENTPSQPTTTTKSSASKSSAFGGGMPLNVTACILLLEAVVALSLVWDRTGTLKFRFGEPIEVDVRVRPGLYYDERDPLMRSVIGRWPQRSWSYKSNNPTPWMYTGDARYVRVSQNRCWH